MRIRHLLAAVGIAAGSLLVVAHPASAKPAGEPEEHCIKLLEDGKSVDDCQKSPNPLLPDTNELLWGGGAFLVVLAVLSKLAFPAIKKGMNDRTERIRGEIDEADRLKAEAASTLAQYQASVADAKAEAARIVDEARTAAEAVRADIIARAEAEANEVKAKGREDVEAGKARAIQELQAQVGDLTIALAEKVVERSLDDATNRQLIDNYINNLGNS
ncbi:MAG TPA: F0F1 ATP synthase subunit B [Acidimicrobiales bacterium]|nr:F0F1 ATP synthase subunit B [Acidimicrobiales bacterium]